MRMLTLGFWFIVISDLLSRATILLLNKQLRNPLSRNFMITKTINHGMETLKDRSVCNVYQLDFISLSFRQTCNGTKDAALRLCVRIYPTEVKPRAEKVSYLATFSPLLGVSIHRTLVASLVRHLSTD